MVKSALVVIDLQEDFLPPSGSLAVEDGRSIVDGIVELLDLAKFPWTFVAATHDWHPKDHILFASQHKAEPYSQVQLPHPLGQKTSTGLVETREFTVWPDHCVQNTPGASLEPRFDKAFHNLQHEVLIANTQKGYLKDREYYLCLSDCWKTHHTELEALLKEAGISHVVLVGLAYDFCVLHSAIDFVQCGFTTYVVSDLSRSVFPEKKTETDGLYADAGVVVLHSALDLPRELFE
ncbi:Isochorismatase hydrolase [Metschnikowia bicuspidata var. bicuspidata NRRL YB-4993]|uniref:nicotinamidase n=1 Tax=Metschnikowia bicuspidata var. bicuspidata NRRL YB-4993 TaxID=869754 RepID=A0A1A0H8S6_9ASCO|nr:Isochorismatase hydrolase [Metschnikowia bicuspidata var. bicuspidata NRRL YB-4993]OBA20288.1 Isochorismatase hydrolase [Metschnikowia bicuspidata var. bicuspidata NRRL YB-4993]